MFTDFRPKFGEKPAFIQEGGSNPHSVFRGFCEFLCLIYGVFGQVETEPVHRTLQDGDYLIMVSDGVVDAFGGEAYEGSLGSIIGGKQDQNPSEIAERLLRMAICAGAGRIRDDMTVGVIGVWEA